MWNVANVIFNPWRMREGYCSLFVCLSVTTLAATIDNRGGRRDWKRALPPVVTSRRMLDTARPLRDDNTDSALQYSRALYGVIWPCSRTKPRSMAKTKRGEENQESKRDFELSFLCYTSYKTLWSFRSLSATELEVRAIEQCLWMPTMCFRSIRELSGDSTRVCELYQQPKAY